MDHPKYNDEDKSDDMFVNTIVHTRAYLQYLPLKKAEFIAGLISLLKIMNVNLQTYLMHQNLQGKEFTVGMYGLLNTFGRTVQSYHQCRVLRNASPTVNLIGMRGFTNVTELIYLNYPLCLTSVNVFTSIPANFNYIKIEQAGSERLSSTLFN